MNQKIKALLTTLSILSFVSLSASAVVVFGNKEYDPADADVKQYSWNEDTPFFSYYDNVEPDNVSSVDRWYDNFPAATHVNNFCSLGTATFENVNGNTVTVDCFNRNVGDALDDPNFGQGILIYQTIKYKMKHPTEEVYIDFASYRTSCTIATCIKPDSKFFGYNRALFDKEYDDFGFVRISFMLVEAARLGIHVLMVPQLNSYGTKQYSSTASSGYAYKDEILIREYFPKSMNVSCYSEYENGKKISDFLYFAANEWDDEQRHVDEQHCKFLAVTAYTDFNNVDHHYAVYTSSSNLDTVNYLGRNANGGAQTGSIVTGHEILYRCFHNYNRYMSQYTSQDSVVIYRDLIRKISKQQFDLIDAGRGDEIPEDEQIVYKGSETDKIFEVYFAPLPGDVSVWDTKYHPYCYYLEEFHNANAPLVFTWTLPYHDESHQIDYTFEELISDAFHKHRHPENRIYIHIDTFNKGLYNDLELGVDIGFKYVNGANINKYLHSKDIIMSYYLDDGTHKFVSILTSMNFGAGTFWYQTNQAIIIKETEENHDVYTILGRATSYGCIV